MEIDDLLNQIEYELASTPAPPVPAQNDSYGVSEPPMNDNMGGQMDTGSKPVGGSLKEMQERLAAIQQRKANIAIQKTPSSSSMGEWRQATTPTGKVYYYNTRTKETKWQNPNEPSSSNINASPPSQPMASNPLQRAASPPPAVKQPTIPISQPAPGISPITPKPIPPINIANPTPITSPPPSSKPAITTIPPIAPPPGFPSPSSKNPPSVGSGASIPRPIFNTPNPAPPTNPVQSNPSQRAMSPPPSGKNFSIPLPGSSPTPPTNAASPRPSSQPAKVENQPWFFGVFSRQQAEELLSKNGVNCFLVRNSSQPGSFACSVYNATTGQYAHELIVPKPGGYSWATESITYPDLINLISNSPTLQGYVAAKKF
jgi:hypothetical protein